MILLILFAFFAGIVTILSPCILPILPIILTSSLGGQSVGKRRPWGVVTGFVLSFTFFTLFLSTIVRVSGVPADVLRLFSIVVIAGFGLSLLLPQFQVIMERLFSSISSRMPLNQNKSGFSGGIIIGLSLGLLWTPCVGPILASVISLAITGQVTLDAFLITLSYSLGTAIPMFWIIAGGQNTLRNVPWLLSRLSTIQKIFGVCMIFTALGIFFNIDRQFQKYILTTFPQYGTGLTKVEDNEVVRNILNKENNNTNNNSNKTLQNLFQNEADQAAEIIPGGAWLNSPPLTLKELKGKVVLIDFWTYTCINCQRTLPYLRSWHEKYKDQGLVIIGVHSPEFEFEKSEKNLVQALKDFGITYPVVQDNNFETWRAYNNHYWPAKYLIDARGKIRYTHFGEGKYDETEEMIQTLLTESGVNDITQNINNPAYEIYSRTPEMYLGYERLDYFASPENIQFDKLGEYTSPETLDINTFSYYGKWKVMKEYANPQKGAKLYLHFESKEVFLVMRTKGTPAKVRVYLNNKIEHLGEDNTNGLVTADRDGLYKLIKLKKPGSHILKLEFEDSNAELYAFTFG